MRKSYLIIVLNRPLFSRGSHTLWGSRTSEGSGGGSRLPQPFVEGCSAELWQFRRYRHLYHLCRHHPAVAVAAFEGLREAVRECQHQMRYHEWDCTQGHPSLPRNFTFLHEPSILRYGQLYDYLTPLKL